MCEITHNDINYKQVTAISFTLLLNLKFECEFQFTKYSTGTEYLFVIHQKVEYEY